MHKLYHVLLAVGLFVVTISAQQIKIFGKVHDTTGTPLADVIVSLVSHPNVADTTGNNGSFMLIGQATGFQVKSSVKIKPFTRCVGNMVYFAISEPTSISIKVFNTLGKQLANPINNEVMPAGNYRIPLTNDFAYQNLFVHVKRGKDTQVFNMQGMNSTRNAAVTFLSNMLTVTGKSSTSLLMASASPPAIDTLVFSRRGSISKTLPIASYTPTDTISIELNSVTDPYLICTALNLAPIDTNYTPHFRNDTTYVLSVVATNVGGGNAYSSEVYVSSADSDIVVSGTKISLSNMQAGATKTGLPISFIIKKRLEAGRKVQLNFHFIDSWSGTTHEWFDTVYWAPKPLFFQGAILDDDNITPTIGNGNLKVEPGERIGIAPILKNVSNLSVNAITGRILTTYSGLDTLAKNSFFHLVNDSLMSGKTGTLDSEFVSIVSPAMKFAYNGIPLIKDSVRYDMILTGVYAGGNCKWIQPMCIAAQPTDTARNLIFNTVNCNVSVSPNKPFFLTGDTVQIAAYPSSHYHFVNWSGDVNSDSVYIKVIMNSTKYITATCAIDSCTLTISSINGNVTINPDKQKYAAGDTVTLTAVPIGDYSFLNWSGAVTGSNNPTKFAITGNSSITANFAPLCTLTVNTKNGIVSKNPDKPQYAYGDTITLTANPSDDCHFLNWNGAVTGSNNPTKFVIKGNSSVTANFSPPCTLTINVTNGTVKKNPDKPQYVYGDTVTLTATPIADYAFESWSGAVTGSDNPIKLVIKANSIVTAKMKVMPGSLVLLTKYNVPQAMPLNEIGKTYTNVVVDGSGPSLLNSEKLTINWTGNLLNRLEINTAYTPYYYDLLKLGAIQTFAQSNPTLTIKNSGITGLDGDYYVTMNNTDFVWVRTDGSYAIVWSTP